MLIQSLILQNIQTHGFPFCIIGHDVGLLYQSLKIAFFIFLIHCNVTNRLMDELAGIKHP